MTGKQLKGYIAPSAPLNFRLCDGTETGLRLVAGFTTNWFYKRVGVCFGEQYHKDPYFRFREIEKMRRYLEETFPTVPCFREIDPVQECATISGVYGVCGVAMAYGMKATYQDHDWPAVHPREQFELDYLVDLPSIHVADTPVGADLLRQIEIIGKEWGKCDGYFNYQGVLGNAFKLMGEAALLNMLMEPEAMEAVFAHAADTTLDMIRTVQTAQRATGFPTAQEGLFSCVSNCLANMISPALYEEMILHNDRRVAGAMTHTGVHTCNWVVDKIGPSLSKIDNLGYVDFSMHSDLDLVQHCFPDARKLVFFSPTDFIGHSDDALEATLVNIYSHFGSCDICLADLDLNTPDAELIRFSAVIDRINEKL